MWLFSQSTYPMLLNDTLIVITPLQLKQTNLIFLEHKKYKLINIELEKQVSNYSQLYRNIIEKDSINQIQINRLQYDLNTSQKQFDNQVKINNKQKSLIKFISIGGIAVSATLLLLLLIR